MRTRRRSRIPSSVGLLAAAVLLAGCASQADPDEAASSGGGSTGSSAATSSTAAGASTTGGVEETAEEAAESTPFLANTDADLADPVDPAGLTVTTVRAAQHDGYDRVVFELAGTGSPGWSVEYVASPSAQGSGEVVDVPGAAHLQVTLQGTTYPYESGATELARGTVAVSGLAVVQGVFYDATFEGTSMAWIGTAEQAPFRVYSLTGPSRVVVEVATAG